VVLTFVRDGEAVLDDGHFREHLSDASDDAFGAFTGTTKDETHTKWFTEWFTRRLGLRSGD
jgi:hypothetical protein